MRQQFWPFNVWAVLALLLFAAQSGHEVLAQTQTRTMNLNTGYDQANSQLVPVGGQDNEWRVVDDPTNQPPATGRPADVVGDSGWGPLNSSGSASYPYSRWISINPNRSPGSQAPPTLFRYAFYFFLPPGFSSPLLTMKLSAGDHIVAVTLNSSSACSLFAGSGGDFINPSLKISSAALPVTCFNSGPSFNVITVTVLGTTGSLTGLIVDGTMTYEDCVRPAVKDIPGLNSITFWESTIGPKPFTFSATGPASPLNMRLSDPLTTSNNDFEGVLGEELYDVFYSDADGAFNPNGQFVTIEGVYDESAPFGGGLNITAVQLNFNNGPPQFADSVSSFVTLGDNASVYHVGDAVDNSTETGTVMGNTIGQTQRLRVTVGFPCPCVNSPTGVAGSCVAPGATVFEYYNSLLDHFFITADPDEQTAVDNGAAGLGWSIRGFFKAGGAAQVCRFYGSLSPGPNSHFYTADLAECQSLKNLQAVTPTTEKRWNFEGNAFLISRPTNGQCASDLVPVYRAYNNGFARGVDSNHRITANQQSYQGQVDKGWIGEGVVMCAPQ